MTDYIAELDESLQIAALWFKTPDSRAPRVFDPERHSFDPGNATRFLGASRQEILDWIASMCGPAGRSDVTS